MTVLQTQWKTLALVLFLPSLQLLGCSLIGLAIGSASDSKSPDDYSYAGTAIGGVEIGSTITLTKWDGSTVEGKHRGVITRSAEVYARSYEVTLEESGHDGYIPHLGDGLTLLTRQSSHQGVYLGIDTNTVLMQLEGDSDTTRISLDSVQAIVGAGGDLPGPDLRRLVYEGTVKSRSYLLVLAEDRNVAVPYEAVRSISVGVAKTGAFVGFVIGLGIDVAVIAIAASTYEPSCKGGRIN